MIENLLTSGCSFTQGNKTWACSISNHLDIPNLFNMGSSGAGNKYICSSVIDAIQYYNLNPCNTLVLVMWSGPSRRDILVSGEYWYLLSDYLYKTKLNDTGDTYWVHSGGRSNSWLRHAEVKKIFQHQYISVDPICDCKEALTHIVNLANFLENHGFVYRFMSYLNYWIHGKESTTNGDFCIPHFASNLPIYQNLNFDNWVFANDQKDGIYEFCHDHDCLSDDAFHPGKKGHDLFVEKVLAPQLIHVKDQP